MYTAEPPTLTGRSHCLPEASDTHIPGGTNFLYRSPVLPLYSFPQNEWRKKYAALYCFAGDTPLSRKT